jgi:8-oxo-dGTP pyrophosphatase MutT (NUDIX family)
MLLHAKLHRWLQPGGHAEPADGGELAQTALREAREETGLQVALVTGAAYPLDVDAHVIPARKTEPEHRHLDVRFLVQAGAGQVLAHDEAEALGSRWLSFADALAQADEPALRRLLRKAQQWFEGAGAAR